MATITYSWQNVVFSVFANDFYLAGDQSGSTLAYLGNGDYLTAWTEPNSGGAQGVEGRLIDTADPDGTIAFNATSTRDGHQVDPALASWTGNRAIMAFTDTLVDVNGDIRVRIFNGTGIAAGPDFLVAGNATVDDGLNDHDTAVSALSDGGFVVSWTRLFGVGDDDIRARIYNADGTPRAGPLGVETSTTHAAFASDVAGLANSNGNFVVVWQQELINPAGTDYDQSVQFRRYDRDGDPLGGPVVIDNFGALIRDIHVAALQDGGFAVAYSDNGWNTGSMEISLVIYDGDGTLRFGFEQVNDDSHEAGDQTQPDITVLSNGYIVVSWIDGEDAYVQAFTPAGARVGGHTNRFTDAIEVSLAGLNNGRLANVRDSAFSDTYPTDSWSIRTHVDQLERTSQGDGAADNFQGDDIVDRMFGAGGADVLRGGAGADEVRGDAGSDVLEVRPGDLTSGDILDGGADGDVLRAAGTSISSVIDFRLGGLTITGIEGLQLAPAGAGIIEARFASSQFTYGGIGKLGTGGQAVVTIFMNGTSINLGSRSVAGFTGANDRFQFFGDGDSETIVGSKVRDFVNGAGGVDAISTGLGNDTVVGGAGNDSIDGGAGEDTAIFSANRAAYAITGNPATGALTVTGPDGTDTLVRINRLQFANQTIDAPGGSITSATMRRRISPAPRTTTTSAPAAAMTSSTRSKATTTAMPARATTPSTSLPATTGCTAGPATT